MSESWRNVAIVILIAFPVAAASPAPQPVDASTVQQVVERLERSLRDVYVFPEVGEKTAAHVDLRMKQGAYVHAQTPQELAAALTDDMRSVAHDKHLGIFLEAAGEGSAKPSAQRDDARQRNFGVQKLEHLPGNVGYLDLREFDDPRDEAATIEGAMSFLSNSDAVIIDLRSNGGGKPAGVLLVASYFFRQPQHFVDIDHRAGGNEQYWTSVVKGKPMPDVPLFLLTSSRTFSAGEGFAYCMQALRRGIVVGETTAGAANPGDSVPLGGGFVAFIPNGRAISPVTGTNWEGTGVKPDVEVPADRALKAALEKIDSIRKQ